jgi:cold shock CspA family protein
LKEGDDVTFEIIQGEKGLQADRVIRQASSQMADAQN